MSRTYVISDVRGRFDVLLRAMESVSIHAREHRTGSVPEHEIVILGNTEQAPDGEQIVEYLAGEQRRRRAAPIILEGGSNYALVGHDFHPRWVVIGIFDDDNPSGGPVELIKIDTWSK